MWSHDYCIGLKLVDESRIAVSSSRYGVKTLGLYSPILQQSGYKCVFYLKHGLKGK